MAGNLLDRIAALADLLTPLDGRQRGEPIQADQWNALVAVLRGILEIDKSQETGLEQSLADSYARADHEHLGQVSLPWLDVDLQDRMVTGGSGSISVRGQLTDVVNRLADVTSTVSDLSARLELIQKRSDDTAVDELGRSSKLRALETRFNGVEDLRGLVTSVSGEVQRLQPDVQTVLDLRSQLTTDAGEPIDVRALNGRVGSLAGSLTDATSGVDGTPLRMRDLQLDVRELQDVVGLGAGGGLEERFAALGAQLSDALTASLDQRLTSAQQDLEARVDQRLDDLQASVDATIDAKLADVIETVTQRVLDTATGQITDAVVAKVLDQVKELVDQRLNEVTDKLTQQVLEVAADKVTDIVLSKVSDQLPSLVDQRVKQQTAELTKALQTAAERIQRLENKVFG